MRTEETSDCSETADATSRKGSVVFGLIIKKAASPLYHSPGISSFFKSECGCGNRRHYTLIATLSVFNYIEPQEQENTPKVLSDDVFGLRLTNKCDQTPAEMNKTWFQMYKPFYIELWCSCDQCKFKSGLQHFQFPFHLKGS